MDEICRLCCSTKFVNNFIFDEENALYLKMSLYLPIKILKNDRLPQKICDKCSCKVNDFYQFCNEAIEVQSRLRALFLASGIQEYDIVDRPIKEDVPSPNPADVRVLNDWGTQTNPESTNNVHSEPVKVKEEEIEVKCGSPISIKKENNYSDDENYDLEQDMHSDDSDDLSLLKLKEIKKYEGEDKGLKNGEVKENKKGRKSKAKLKDLKLLIDSLPDSEITVLNETSMEDLNVDEKVQDKLKASESETKLSIVKIKLTPLDEIQDTYQCCICLEKYKERGEILRHYRSHPTEPSPPTHTHPSATPPLPTSRPLRCPRCERVLQAGEWAAHWRRHWERDRQQPYRCSLCEKSFRDTYQLFRHGLTHDKAAAAAAAAAPSVPAAPNGVPDKRFVCDLCPESFVYMRCLQSHRTRAHPEAASRPFALRCRVCGRQFAHMNSLQRHLRSHSGERNFLCNVCGKALSSSEHLKFHIRIHTGYKPNVCKTCGKGFVKKCNLTLHERVHSGEKPYVCSHCGKAFSQRSTLVIHERYHSGARPYSCAECGRGFVAKGLLTMHEKTRCYAPDAARH